MKPGLCFFVSILFSAIILESCSSPQYRDLQAGESDTEYILSIAKKLSDQGSHNPGTPEERQVGDFIVSELKNFHIAAQREEFTFQTYVLDSTILEIEGQVFKAEFSGINPFDSSYSQIEELCLVDEEGNSETNPEGKIMVTSNPDLYFMGLQVGSKAMISLNRDDFEQLKKILGRKAQIRIHGKIQSRLSSNIIVNIGKHKKKAETVYFSAHYDSYGVSPGANDNGTGVGGILAMARLLKPAEKSLPFNVRLIIFGAEEAGMIGSRHYVSSHLDELFHCKLLINFDTFGGNEGPYIATAKGLQGVSASDIENRLDLVFTDRALEGPGGNWRMFEPSIIPMILSSNYPEWVQDIVDSVSGELNLELFNQHLLSDHLSFAQAGVPAISVQSREHHIHTEADTPENLNPEMIFSCFRLSHEVLKKLDHNLCSSESLPLWDHDK